MWQEFIYFKVPLLRETFVSWWITEVLDLERKVENFLILNSWAQLHDDFFFTFWFLSSRWEVFYYYVINKWNMYLSWKKISHKSLLPLCFICKIGALTFSSLCNKQLIAPFPKEVCEIWLIYTWKGVWKLDFYKFSTFLLLTLFNIFWSALSFYDLCVPSYNRVTKKHSNTDWGRELLIKYNSN